MLKIDLGKNCKISEYYSLCLPKIKQGSIKFEDLDILIDEDISLS